MNLRLRHLTSAALTFFLGAVAVPALDPVAPAAWSAPAECRAATPAALGGFFDGAVPGRLAHDHVPGAVVSVVSGGRAVFAKGYGLADAEHRVPFDPARSLVRIASITKLFTWTAVMQQVQAGRLDLNTDVNHYLKTFKIPATYPEPVTLQTLMNHTAGFEDRIVGTGARTAGDVPPLGDYLAHNMPARIRPPGEVSSYSNYGAGLAGYIVSQVSGEPYDRYVQQHLLAPLNMTHSTATEPIPAPLVRDLARSYDSDASPPRPVPFTFDAMPPDGSMSVTADDMANFMIANLREGRFGANTILSPATAAQMDQTSFAADPRVGGYAHGFRELTINGHRVLMHDGGWEGFESVLMMVPDCDLGVFVSANGTGGTDTLNLTRDFFDRFAPASAASSTGQAPSPASHLAAAPPRSGFYEPARHNESTFEKILVLLGPARLTVRGDGTVRFNGKVWTPRGNGMFALPDDSDRLVSLTGPHGGRYLATNETTYQLTATGQTPPVNLSILLFFTVVVLSALAIPLAALWRRISRRPAARTGLWRVARSLAAGAALGGLGFLILLTVQLFGDASGFIYGVPAAFEALLLLPLLIFVAGGAAAVCTVVGWRGSGAGLPTRIHQVALFTGLAALAWFLWQWNLIGWQFL